MSFFDGTVAARFENTKRRVMVGPFTRYVPLPAEDGDLFDGVGVTYTRD